MIRAIRPNAMAQDDAAMVSGWNIAPNLAYVLRVLPGAASCGVLLYDESGTTLIATGAALVGSGQPCLLIPQTGQIIGMVDADLGWHLLLTTTGPESQRTIRLGPAVDLPDEIHPVYGTDALALARATAAIDAAAHYVDDITVTCPVGLRAGLGDVVSVPVDGEAVVGQVESVTWTATPDGAIETAVIRRHVAIAPDLVVEATPPEVADDTGTATHLTGAAGNVLANDATGLTVVAVNGLTSKVGIAVDGSSGGLFTIATDGSWTFDPDGDFALLSGAETAETFVTYHVSDGTSEAPARLTVTVSRVNTAPVAVDDSGTTDAATSTSGNVLINDTDTDADSLAVLKVSGSAANVGVAVAGSNGGLFTVGSDGAWTFDPNGDFDSLTGEDTAMTSVTYHVSDGAAEDEGNLTMVVSAAPVSGIAVVGTSSGSIGTGASYSVPLPDGVQEGDLVIVATGYYYYTDTNPGVSTPGYTEVADLYASDTLDVNLSVNYKFMGETPDPSVTVNGSGGNNYTASTCIFVVRGVNNATPLDVSAVTATGGNTAIANPPAITPVTIGALVLSVVAYTTNGLGVPTPPTMLENLVIKGELGTGTVGFFCSIGSVPWESGAVDVPAWSTTGSGTNCAWAAVSLALRPA